MSVLVVGDALLEVTVAPSEPMRRADDARASIGIGPGGQGANVAVRLARRGIEARLVAAVGDDPGGRLVREWLAAEGVSLVAAPGERTGAVLVTLDAAGERSMLSDRVAFESRLLDAALLRAVAGAGWVHVSGYVLRGADAAAVASVLRDALDPATRLSVAGGSLPPEEQRDADLFRAALAAMRPDLLVLARDEAAALLDADEDPAALAARLAEQVAVSVVTAGIHGAAMAAGGETTTVAAHADPRPVVDATGAGDAYVAALIARLVANTAWPPEGATLAEAARQAARAGASAARVHGAQGAIDGESPAARLRT